LPAPEQLHPLVGLLALDRGRLELGPEQPHVAST
jgi:hypothetical protein